MTELPRCLGQRTGRSFYQHFGELRPVQQQTLAPILGGEDVLIRAGTGSGKTEAAAAPLVERYLEALDHTDGVTILYVCPTRALGNDLLRRLEPVMEQLQIPVGIRHGERDDVSRATTPRILITTPESLDVMVGKELAALGSVQAIVLDEAHLLMNTQRGLQLAIVLRRLERWLDRSVQMVGLSATLGDPTSVWMFFRPGDHPTVIEDTAGDRTLSLQIRLDLSSSELSALLARLDESEPAKVLVFVNSRRVCDTVAEQMRNGSGFEDGVLAHHASLSRDERVRVESEFQQRRRAICVATSTLELGIDIGDINLVVMYGVPSGWQSFLQRLGRSNRRSNRVEAVGAVPRPEGNKPARLRDRLGFQTLRSQVRSGNNETADAYQLYGAAAQQLCSLIDSKAGAYVGLSTLVDQVGAAEHLDSQVIEQILNELVDQGVLQRHPVYRRYGAAGGLWELRRNLQLWSNFPLGSRDIEIRHAGSTLGRVPATNLVKLTQGSVFVFSSRRWKVTATDADGIKVVPATAAVTALVSSNSPAAPLDPSLADDMRSLIADDGVSRDVVPASTGERLSAEFAPLQRYAEPGVLPFSVEADRYVYVTFGGALLNQVVSSWAGADGDVGEFHFSSSAPVNFDRLPEDPSALADHVDASVLSADRLSPFQQLLPGDLLRREFMNEWLHQPVHERVLRRLSAASQQRMPTHLLDLVRR